MTELATIFSLWAAFAAPAQALVSTSVSSPLAGARLTGNAVTVAASVAAADLYRTDQVRFQFRAVGAASWLDVSGATAQPNPDLGAPFYSHWDVSGLAPGNYELRAIASDSDGPDPAPPALIIVVDPAGFSINESRLGAAVRRDQSVTRTATSEISNGDASRAQLAHVLFPAGALDQPAAIFTILSNPPALPAGPGGSAFLGSLDLSLSDGQHCLCSGQAAALTLSYLDSDHNGIVDGTSSRVSALRLFRYDDAAGKWVKDFPSSVDTAGRSVTALITQLGRYALVAPPAVGVARVYPVPYKPNGSNPDEGRPFIASDPDSGVVFDNMPQATRIDIFTDSGSRIRRLDVGSSGRLQWDARNEQGQDAASGFYIAVITPPGESAQRRKLLIVR